MTGAQYSRGYSTTAGGGGLPMAKTKLRRPRRRDDRLNSGDLLVNDDSLDDQAKQLLLVDERHGIQPSGYVLTEIVQPREGCGRVGSLFFPLVDIGQRALQPDALCLEVVHFLLESPEVQRLSHVGRSQALLLLGDALECQPELPTLRFEARCSVGVAKSALVLHPKQVRTPERPGDGIPHGFFQEIGFDRPRRTSLAC